MAAADLSSSFGGGVMNARMGLLRGDDRLHDECALLLR
jgi:hypothetical protein